MPSLPLVVIAEARSLAWRCGIDDPSALSLTAQAWTEYPDPMWRTVAHRRCVDERRRLSGRDGPDHQPIPILDQEATAWGQHHEQSIGSMTIGELIPCEEPGFAEVENRCDLVALIGDLPDDELAQLARHYWLGMTEGHSPRAVVLARALRHARNPQPPPQPLPPQPLRCLQLAAHGHTNQQIARLMAISLNTVKTHLQRACAQIGAHNRAHAVAIALRAGWIT